MFLNRHFSLALHMLNWTPPPLSSYCSLKKTMQVSLVQAPQLLNRHWRGPRPTWTGWPWTRNQCWIGSPVRLPLHCNTVNCVLCDCEFYSTRNHIYYCKCSECGKVFYLKLWLNIRFFMLKSCFVWGKHILILYLLSMFRIFLQCDMLCSLGRISVFSASCVNVRNKNHANFLPLHLKHIFFIFYPPN